MNSDYLNEILTDISAFADDDEDVVIDKGGQCLFVRNGEEMQLKFVLAAGQMIVEVDGERVPYGRFLTHNLAQLPVLAERILTKRSTVSPYVDSAAHLQSAAQEQGEGNALQLLREQTANAPPFLSRVVFITADAGQGKTALLREFQQHQAKAFLAGQSSSLFWHVDLQGRQLLRLHEALMGDLGDLRVSGLWMSSIIRLLRRGALSLGIDGFDELAAEQGGTDALGALSLLVHQLESQGTIVAASRRTFFDTDDYIRRAGIFQRASECEFNEIRLEEWDERHALTYLAEVAENGRSFDDPKRTYSDISSELGTADHPMLTRPFLLSQVSRGLLLYGIPVADFIRGKEDRLKGVGTVIEAFVDREIHEKWKQPDSGEPFLTKEQHLRLLADVAEEMFRSQRSTIGVDVLETITMILFDEWKIDPDRRRQVLDMVRMHVLLTPPSSEEFGERSFDHEEFRDWFTAYALKERLQQLGEGRHSLAQDILSVAHLPDATARYVCSLIDRTPKTVGDIAQGLAAMVREEWKPTFLQANAGTIIPFLLDGVVPSDKCEIDAGVAFTSLVHEGKHLEHLRIKNATFANASLADVSWHDVELVQCSLGELTFNRDARFEQVRLVDCTIDGIRLLEGDGEDETREYSPSRIATLLGNLGVELVVSEPDQTDGDGDLPDGELRKLARRLLNTFRRTTFVVDETVQKRFRGDAKRVKEELIPFMESFEILEKRKWKGSGKHEAWGLVRQLEEIEKADGHPDHPFNGFWSAIDEADRTKSKLG